MKRLILPLFFLAAVFVLPRPAEAALEHLAGWIVLQVESHGEAWYISPTDLSRHYLGRPDDAWNIMRSLGLGITNADLARIPTVNDHWDGDARIMPHVRGRVVLQVEENGEAWYVFPGNGKRYYLGRPHDAFAIMSGLGLGITNADLERIGMSDDSVQEHPDAESPFVLSVPFTAQAPHANWSAPYNEACEEAILVMLDHYFRHDSISADEANAEILRLVDWQNENFGYYQDTGVHQTGQMAAANYGWTYRVSFDVTEETIKQELRNGHPVILPVAGQDIGNIHFTPPGPVYHMVLVIGYHEDHFITNDPGTRYGGMYQYPMTTLLNAVHDLTNPESAIREGRPAMLIVEP